MLMLLQDPYLLLVLLQQPHLLLLLLWDLYLLPPLLQSLSPLYPLAVTCFVCSKSIRYPMAGATCAETPFGLCRERRGPPVPGWR